MDALISGWQLSHVPKTQEGQLDHAGRLEVDHTLGSSLTERADIVSSVDPLKTWVRTLNPLPQIERARKYQNHWQFWAGVPVKTHLVLYEELMKNRLPTLMSMLAFLLPSDELPSLTQIACALELNEEAEAYKVSGRCSSLRTQGS